LARTLTLAGLTTAALLASVTASAKQTSPASSQALPPAATVSGITVEGAAKQNPLVDRTTEFVRQRLPTSRFEQYARFHDPICVKVVGLPGEYDAFVAKRIVDMAREVKAPVSGAAACKPNVNVIFSTHPQAQLDDIAKRREDLLGFHFSAQLRGLSAVTRPIQAWYLTRTQDTTGRATLDVKQTAGVDMEDIVRGGADIGGGEAAGGDFGPHGRPGSRLGSDMSTELAHSLIIADANKLAGEKIDAVADYIAVLALSRWQGLERCSGLPTILNLMADGCDAEDRPEAVTPEDLALLTGLYQVNSREAGTQQRAEIAEAVRKAANPATDSRH
jgi:hypothetical protein